MRQVGRGFTYRHMLFAMAGWFAFMGLLYGIQLLRLHAIDSDVEMQRQQIGQLDAEKEKQMDIVKGLGRQQLVFSGKQNIQVLIAMRPRWSKTLRALAHALPVEVWLDGVTVAEGGDEWAKLQITGKAKSQRVLTTFILQLEGSGFFSKTALDKTRLESEKTGGLEFEMSTQVVLRRLLQDG